MSIPGFWLALLLILFFSVYLGWLPVLSDPGIKGLILPALALGLWAGGTIARLVRSGMLEVIRQDYIRTAHAKGLADRAVVYGTPCATRSCPSLRWWGCSSARFSPAP